MTMKGIGRSAREVFLTFGALLGVLCIVATIAGVAFGVKPLVFRSGSMSPAIHTGDLAVSRTVDANTLKTGDIVSVVNSEGNRVTHRVVNIASQGRARQLTLRGDANKTADSEVYTVTRAERVLFDIPKAGYVVNAAASPIGVFALGAFVTAMLLLAFPPAGSRRTDRWVNGSAAQGWHPQGAHQGRQRCHTIGCNRRVRCLTCGRCAGVGRALDSSGSARRCYPHGLRGAEASDRELHGLRRRAVPEDRNDRVDRGFVATCARLHGDRSCRPGKRCR